ncbi:DUF805 domain-containing protein [Aestuariivirga sp.]|uniref:DUF805 domain-containing protein n=1 Tax=Aestuariivirga sp. TaxID=2650926 RepID=UPI0039E4366C
MSRDLFLSFEGRIGRQAFWLGLIALLVIEWIVFFLVLTLFGGSLTVAVDGGDSQAAMAAMYSLTGPAALVSLIFLWPALAIQIKRWHDRNKSGWWVLIAFLPIIGGLWVLIECGFLRGTVGPNAYGPDPVAAG